MSRSRVVVLTAHSMFTAGIVSRLRRHLDQIDVQVVDSRQPDCLARIRRARPAVILLETNDKSIDRHCPLGRLLEAAPRVKVIQLDRDRDQIRVITGELRTMQRPVDLIRMLLPTASGAATGLKSDPGDL